MTDSVLASLGVVTASLSGAQRAALDEEGYLVLPAVVATRDLGQLRSAFDRACELEGIAHGGTRHPTGLLDCDPAFRTFAIHPGVLAAIRHILGLPFRMGAGAGRDPQPGHGQQGLHSDCVDFGPGTPYQVVTALGLLDDFRADNGATRLVPGSHLFRRPPPKSFADPASRHPAQVIVTAAAGSVLVFNGHLWHGGTCNRSSGHRRVIQCSFGGVEITPTVAPAGR
jgi:ectoine hydroxylase-related dioxygenase (phytanoyl-CoA dioxygenase family)